MRRPKAVRGFRGFWAHDRGAIAIIFALSLIPLLMAAGVAIDLIRGQHARYALQAAVDAAVLAVGSDSQSTPETVGPVIQNYLNANFPVQGLVLTDTDVEFSEGSDTIGFSATATLPTTFMRVAGIDEIDIDVRTEAIFGDEGPLDLVMVVDITSSMATQIAGRTRMAYLRDAARNLTNEVMTHDEARFSIVPFFNYVRLDPSAHRSARWLDVEADKQMPTNCRVVTPASGCRTVATTCDGVPCQAVRCDRAAVSECDSVTRSWTGCVGNRREAYHMSISDPITAPYFGFVSSSDTACGPVSTELTNDKSTILSAIAALTPPGGAETYMPAGLIWGWNMLTSQDPLTRAHSPEFMQQNGGRRALVLMTDGINSVAPENRSSWRIINANNSTYRNWGPRNTSYTDHLTAQLCERIKADGIDVYTVAFTVDDADTDTLLRNCATDPGKFYKALTPNALFRAFDDIGDSLKRVRLAQ